MSREEIRDLENLLSSFYPNPSHTQAFQIVVILYEGEQYAQTANDDDIFLSIFTGFHIIS